MFSQSIFPLLTLIKVQKTTKYKLFISFPPHYMNKICIFAGILKENRYKTFFMINPIVKTIELPDGRTITLETGKLAKQADGSVMLRWRSLSSEELLLKALYSLCWSVSV